MVFKFKRSGVGVSCSVSVGALLIGVLLLAAPGIVLDILSIALSVICVFWGATRLYRALRGHTGPLGIFAAVLALLFGIQTWRHPGSVFVLLPIAAGFFFIYDGVDRIRTAIAHTPVGSSYLSRMGAAGIFGIILILAGMWLILFPIGAQTLLLRLIGLLIVLDSLCDLWQFWQGSRPRKNEPQGMRRSPDGTYEAEYRDITDD